MAEELEEPSTKSEEGSCKSKDDELLPIYNVRGCRFGVYERSCHTNKITPSRERRTQRLHIRTQDLKPDSNVQELLKAAGEANSSKIRHLLGTGTGANSSDFKKRTALHIAASKGHNEIVKLLIQNGADVNKTDSIGNTPLHLAACTQHVNVITTLLEAGSRLDLTAGTSKLHPLRFVTGRIQLLSRNESREAECLRLELLQIVRLLQSYMKLQSQADTKPNNQSSRSSALASQSDSNSSIDDLAKQLEGICNLTDILDVSDKLYNLSCNELR